MNRLLSALQARQWIVRVEEEPQPLPPIVASRYPTLPPEVRSWIGMLADCHNAAEDIWFMTPSDYALDTADAFRWNEIELMSLEGAANDTERQQIVSFWDRHFPFLLAVHSDYDYVALRLAPDQYGIVVHGYAPEFEEPSIVAPSFADFLSALERAAGDASPAYPFSSFL